MKRLSIIFLLLMSACGKIDGSVEHYGQVTVIHKVDSTSIIQAAGIFCDNDPTCVVDFMAAFYQAVQDTEDKETNQPIKDK